MTTKRRSTASVRPASTGQLAALIVQVGPAVCSLQMEVPPTPSEAITVAPLNSVPPVALVARRMRTRSKAARATLASAAR